MRRTQKRVLIFAGCAGITLTILAIMVLTNRLLANRGMVKAFITTKAAQMTGGELDYSRLDLDYLPFPHLVARDIRLVLPGTIEMKARRLSLYPRIRALLTGRFSIRRPKLNTPDVRVYLAASPVKSEPTTAGQATVLALSSRVQKQIGSVFAALAVIDPDTQARIVDGRVSLAFPDRPEIRITAIKARIENVNQVLSLDLRGSSNVIGELKLAATVNVDESKADGIATFKDVDLHPLFSHAALPGKLSIDPTRASVEVGFTVPSANKAECRLTAKLPSLTIRRMNRKLALAGATLSGAVNYENNRLVLTIDTLSTRKPALNFSATADLTPDENSGAERLRLGLGAEKLDLATAGDLLRGLFGDLDPIATTLDIVREGYLTTPRYVVDLTHGPSGWHLKKMKATGRLSQGRASIPGAHADLQELAGEVFYEDGHLAFEKFSGRFEGAAFKALDASIDWEKQPGLSIASSSVRVDAAPFFTWLTGFEGLAGIRRHVTAMTGHAALSGLTISGPLAEPEKWDFTIRGSPEALRLTSPLVPFTVELSGGEIVYRPDDQRSSNVGITLLDSTFVSSNRWTRFSNPPLVTWQADGTMGPETLAWLNTVVTIPDHLQMKPPVRLLDAKLKWNDAASFSLTGGLKTAGGVDLHVDLTHEADAWRIRKFQFSDGHSAATLSGSKRASAIDLTFSGNVDKQTADRLLKNNQILTGRLEGDFQARIDVDNPLAATFSGRLSGSGLRIRALTRAPLDIRSFSINGLGKRLDLTASEIHLGDSTLRVSGFLENHDEALSFDAAVAADRLDDSLIQAIQRPQGANEKTTEKKSAPIAMPQGMIHLSADDLTVGGFTWSPVKADIRVAADHAHITVDEAQLCGISTTGELDYSPRGIGFDINPTAKGASLEQTVGCLQQKPISAEARYDLTGAIHLPPTQDNPLQAMTGRLTFSSENGRIHYESLLMKIFSILNISEVFTGGKSDLAEDGYGYTKAYATAAIGNGDLQLEEILLDGNALKLTGKGTIHLKDASADIILLAAPLKTVDRIVDKIPIVNYITGGSLISVPLRLHGKLSNPSIVILPPSAVGKGLLKFMQRTLKAPFKLVEDVGKFAAKHSPKGGDTEETPQNQDP